MKARGSIDAIKIRLDPAGHPIARRFLALVAGAAHYSGPEPTARAPVSKRRQKCRQSAPRLLKSLSPGPNQSTIAKAGADWNAR
jgi:hypothetical protein